MRFCASAGPSPLDGHGQARAIRSINPELFSYVALAAGVATLAGDLGSVFMVFAVGAAVFLVGHACTSGMGAFLLISHMFFSPFWECLMAVLRLGCRLGSEFWRAQANRSEASTYFQSPRMKRLRQHARNEKAGTERARTKPQLDGRMCTAIPKRFDDGGVIVFACGNRDPSWLLLPFSVLWRVLRNRLRQAQLLAA